jgi:hypothetical protein
MRPLKSARIPAVSPKIFLVAAFFCWIFFNARPLAAENASVEVANISGPVQVLLSDADDYVDAQEGMVLEARDKIKTQSSGSAELSFNEQNTNIVRLEADTNAEILLQDSEKIEVAVGEVFASIAELPGSGAFEIRTPTAVSGARGTDWVTKVDEEGTEVEAVENDSYVKEIQSDGRPAQEATVVKTGYATTVRPFQRPLPLRALSQERRRRWQEVKGAVRQKAAAALIRRKEQPPFNRGAFIKNLREKKPELFKGAGRPGSLQKPRPQPEKNSRQALEKKQNSTLKPVGSQNIQNKGIKQPLGQAKPGSAVATKPKNLSSARPRR